MKKIANLCSAITTCKKYKRKSFRLRYSKTLHQSLEFMIKNGYISNYKIIGNIIKIFTNEVSSGYSGPYFSLKKFGNKVNFCNKKIGVSKKGGFLFSINK